MQLRPLALAFACVLATATGCAARSPAASTTVVTAAEAPREDGSDASSKAPHVHKAQPSRRLAADGVEGKDEDAPRRVERRAGGFSGYK